MNDELLEDGLVVDAEIAAAAGEDTAEEGVLSEEGGEDALSVDSEELEECVDLWVENRPPGLSAEASLAWWYSAAQSVCCDAADELGGNESSLISAEGLLLRICCGREHDMNFLHKPRFLEIIYQVELFMCKLTEVGVSSYSLVFFDCFKATLLRQHPLLWALRNALLSHCQQHTGAMPWARFENWYAPEFDEFVTRHMPFVFFVEETSNINVDDNEALAALLDYKPLPPGEHGFGALYLLMLNALGRQINVCALYDLHIITRRVKAWSLNYSSYSFKLEQEVKDEILRAQDDLVAKVDDFLDEPVALAIREKGGGQSSDDPQTSAAAEGEDYASASALRLDLAIAAAKSTIMDYKEPEALWSIFFFKALVLHGLLLDRLSASERRCVLKDLMLEVYSSTLTFVGLYYQHYTEALTAKKTHASSCQTPCRTSAPLVDLFDELTLRRTIFFLCTSLHNAVGADPGDGVGVAELGIETTAAAEVEAAWQAAFHAPFFPIRVDASMVEGGGSLPADCSVPAPAPEDEGLVVVASHKHTSESSEETSGTAEAVEWCMPTVAPIHSNDLVNRLVNSKTACVPNVMEDSGEDQGEYLLKLFRQHLTDTAGVVRAVTDGGETFAFKTGLDVDTYDFSTNLIKPSWTAPQRAFPSWIDNVAADKRERVIKRWELRKQQEGRAFARDLNKFMGTLDRLHRPIVLVGGHCTNEHPWYATSPYSNAQAANLAALSSAAAVAVGGGTGVPEKEKASKKPASTAAKISTKAAAIIEKNKEAKEEKQKKKDSDGSDQLKAQLEHIFRKKIESPLVFINNFLELFVGTRNAMDTTVLEDFPALNKAISLPENRLQLLTRTAELVFEPLERNWRLRSLAGKEAGVVKLIGVLFRFVQVATEKYLSYMELRHVKVFQSLLLTLGFVNSARVFFDHWALEQWEKKQRGEGGPGAEKDGGDGDGVTASPAVVVVEEKKKKAGKPGANKGGGTKVVKGAGGKEAAGGREAGGRGGGVVSVVNEKLEAQKRSYVKKLDVHRVKKSLRTFDYSVRPEIEMTFQMDQLGADMTRSLGSVKDPRVHFLPDGWQARLLDAVDSQESALVVAPTSSGKTFICYYAMDQALRYDNDACVVFVSPTRALALQVESEVTARFHSKTYPPGSKVTLCGHLYEDRQNNWDNCQILITVPAVFDALLSSKSRDVQQWQHKLKYVIIDEVHCIADEKLGRDCETYIQLLPCPFMALSATVGNVEDFRHWLASAQAATNRQRPIRFIKHNERYADLKTFIYSSQQKALYGLNPILSLNAERIKAGTLTGDLALVPTDCLQLFHAVIQDFRDHPEGITPLEQKNIAFFEENWNPEIYFHNTKAITKRQYGYYMRSVCHTLEAWVRSGCISEQRFISITRIIGREGPLMEKDIAPWYKVKERDLNAKDTVAKQAVPTSSASAIAPPASSSSTTTIAPAKAKTLAEMLEIGGENNKALEQPAEFLILIRKLERQRLLPALVFNFNRALASRLFYRLVHKLLNDHRDRFYGTPELAAQTRAINKEREDKYKQELSRRDMVEKLKTLSKQQREEQGIDEQMLAELSGAPPPPPADIADEHDPDFFLCDKRMYLSYQEEYREILNFCRIDHWIRTGRIAPVLIEALRRGIGFYHDALHREYRRAVEFLFRARYLRIVVSDISLSMGVNMPCRSTVFAGDSNQLTPLLFRQTAGRAGRRGFDSLGHVVFWDITFKKIRRVLCSQLPVMSGKFPIRGAPVLKVLKLAKISDDLIIASCVKDHQKLIQKIDESRLKYMNLLQVSLFELGAPPSARNMLDQLYKIEFRYALETLLQLGVLNPKAQPLPLSVLIESLAQLNETNLFLPFAILNGCLFKTPEDEVAGSSSNMSDFEKKRVLKNLNKDMRQSLVHLLGLVIERRLFTHSVVRRFELASRTPECHSRLFPRIPLASALETGLEWTPLLAPLPESVEKVAEHFDQIMVDIARKKWTSLTLAGLASGRAEEAHTASLPRTKVNPFPNRSGDGENPPPPDDGGGDGGGGLSGGGDQNTRSLKSFISDTRCTPHLCVLQSPFCAGEYDYMLTTPEALSGRCRPWVYSEPHSVPQVLKNSCEVVNPRSGAVRRVPLINSYLPELLEHKNLRSIIEHNKVNASEAYFAALDVLQAIRQLFTAMQTVVTRGAGSSAADYSQLVLEHTAGIGEGLRDVQTHIRR